MSGVEGTTIIATGTGTVKEIVEDETYGTKVTIEHENGYDSISLNNGEILVKTGDTVMQGAALFIVTPDNLKLKYSIKENGQLINPMDVVEISG